MRCGYCGLETTGNHICPKMVNPPLLIVMGGRFLMDEFRVNANLGQNLGHAPLRVERRIYVAPADGSVPSC